MRNLRNILLASSTLLSSCNDVDLLTQEKFDYAEWMMIPNNGEIWTSYMGEEIPRYTRNWEMYQEQVALKNNLEIKIGKNGNYVIKFGKADSILVPDLDGIDGVDYKGKPKEIKEVRQIANRRY